MTTNGSIFEVTQAYGLNTVYHTSLEFECATDAVSSVSGVQVFGVMISSHNPSVTIAFETTATIPLILTTDLDGIGVGGATDALFYTVTVYNTYYHADSAESLIALSAVTYAQLSAGDPGFTLSDYDGVEWSYYLSALGDQRSPSGANNFAANTEGINQIELTWTYPGDTDISGCRIARSTVTYPSAYNTWHASTVYMACGVSYTDTGLDDQTDYYYSAYLYDTSGKYSSGVSIDGNPMWNSWTSQAEHTRLYEVEACL